MARSYQEILEKVMPLAGRDPGRFKRFYDRVTELLLRIPEGGSIIVSEHCTARSFELFMDVAEMCIIEELFHKSINDALLEFSDDRSEIRRCPAWRPAVPYRHFYSDRNV